MTARTSTRRQHRPTARYCKCAAHARVRTQTPVQRSSIARRAALIRWGRVSADSPALEYAQTPRAVEMRRRRALARRMAAYDGVKYDDRMASSERVRVAYLDLYGPRPDPDE